MSTGKKWFFGWTNIKWNITELTKIFTDAPSYFSKKRIESGIAFVVGQSGMIYYLVEKIQTMTMTEMLMWAGIEFGIAGWTVMQIQKEKKGTNNESTEEQQLNS